MKNVTIVLAVVAVLVLAGPAWGALTTWNRLPASGPGGWEDNGNWDDDEPTSAHIALINNGGTAVVTGTDVCLELKLSFGTTQTGHAAISSGSLTAGGLYIGVRNTGVTSANASTFTQTDGDVICDGFVIVGGALLNSWGGKGKYTISGGSLTATTLDIQFGPTAGQEGILRVEGADASIGIGAYNQNPQGSPSLPAVLQCAVDADSGISLIGVTGTAAFYDGSILDMDFLDATKADKWDLLTAGATVGEANLVLKAEDQFDGTTGWTIDWRNAGNGRTLRATYVPEPATMALLGIGGLGVMLRRRRNRA